MTDAEVEAVALALPPKERARLAERLLASLESLSPAERDELWVEETLRRDAELDADPALGRDNNAVFAAARNRLAK